jgi:STE24 endopeptidase
MDVVYPIIIEPFFSKYTPLQKINPELCTKITEFCSKIGFKTNNVLIVDTSRRSKMVNAAVTNNFGIKKIIIFDNLINLVGIDTNKVIDDK